MEQQVRGSVGDLRRIAVTRNIFQPDEAESESDNDLVGTA